MTYEDVSRAKAKALIDEADGGLLVLIDAEPVPTIGDVPPEDREVAVESTGYRFGKSREEDDA